MKNINKIWTIAIVVLGFAFISACNTNRTEDSYEDNRDSIERNNNDMPDGQMDDSLLRRIDSLEINSDTLAQN